LEQNKNKNGLSFVGFVNSHIESAVWLGDMEMLWGVLGNQPTNFCNGTSNSDSSIELDQIVVIRLCSGKSLFSLCLLQ
jgi:hypothetical protein